jgi:hypothetical protein
MAGVMVEDGYLKAGYSYLNLDGACYSAHHQSETDVLMSLDCLRLQSCRHCFIS